MGAGDDLVIDGAGQSGHVGGQAGELLLQPFQHLDESGRLLQGEGCAALAGDFLQHAVELNLYHAASYPPSVCMVASRCT